MQIRLRNHSYNMYNVIIYHPNFFFIVFYIFVNSASQPHDFHNPNLSTELSQIDF